MHRSQARRLGWAICNKVKRTNQYKDTPMIVTSQEATDKDFEDHKKLRTRAEEYLHKPYSIEVLLSKVDRIVGLRAANSDDALSLDDAVLEEPRSMKRSSKRRSRRAALVLPKGAGLAWIARSMSRPSRRLPPSRHRASRLRPRTRRRSRRPRWRPRFPIEPRPARRGGRGSQRPVARPARRCHGTAQSPH